jgi:uncharacterized membrane protein SpoIIM required for sporulation
MHNIILEQYSRKLPFTFFPIHNSVGVVSVFWIITLHPNSIIVVVIGNSIKYVLQVVTAHPGFIAEKMMSDFSRSPYPQKQQRRSNFSVSIFLEFM